jgi:hypothetical protein
MRVLRRCNLLDNQHDDITHQFWADDKEDAEEYINAGASQICKNTVQASL